MAQAPGVQEPVDAAEAPVKVTAEQLGLTPGEEHAGQLEFDLGNLAAFDPAPLDTEALAQPGPQREAACHALATSITQSLVAQLFALPAEAVAGGRLAQLPEPSTRLPREKPLPKAKPLTKWQKFAQEKGIRKRKRSSLTYDEDAGEWRRRYGYKRANSDADVPIIEASANDKVGEDPFERMAAEKRERVRKNAKQQLGNVKDASKAGGKAALPATLKLATALQEKGQGKVMKRKELKDEIKLASRLSGVSTASMGKFDQRLPGEKPNERTAPGHRKKFASVTDTANERAALTKYADRFLRERSDDVLDVRKAIGHFEAAAREERHAAKQGGEDGAAGSGSKGGRKGGKGGRQGGKGGKGGSKGGGGKAGGGKAGGGKAGGGKGKQKGGGSGGLGVKKKGMKGGRGKPGGGKGKKGAR